MLQGRQLSKQQPVKELCERFLSQQVPSPHLLAMVVDMCEEEAAEGNKESLARAKEVRAIYMRNMQKKYGGLIFFLPVTGCC